MRKREEMAEEENGLKIAENQRREHFSINSV